MIISRKKTNKIVILTGGSSGIGLATAQLFASRDYFVFELSRRDINHQNAGIEHISCDVTNEEQVKTVVDDIFKQTNHIDVLISNAGYGISGPIEFTSSVDAHNQFEVNFFGSLNVVKSVLPYMRKQGYGKIIFTSSVAAVLSIPYQAFYSATKSAINSLALALRNEVADFGIKVCAIMPGDVSTGFTDARSKNSEGQQVYTHTQKAIEAMEKDERGGMSAQYLARNIYRIVQKNNPAPLYTAGWQYKCFVVLEKLLPKRISNWIVGLLYR